ncbi:hypothetical protein BD408DRAFT_410290 [Parasitella parasitica]|nr:hypothetical protein BD408DRAFT_410290 [Parasitella parasitica]
MISDSCTFELRTLPVYYKNDLQYEKTQQNVQLVGLAFYTLYAFNCFIILQQFMVFRK